MLDRRNFTVQSVGRQVGYHNPPAIPKAWKYNSHHLLKHIFMSVLIRNRKHWFFGGDVYDCNLLQYAHCFWNFAKPKPQSGNWGISLLQQKTHTMDISTHSTKNLDLFKVIYFVPWDSSPCFSTILRRIFLGHTLRSIQSQIPKNTSTYSTRYFPPPYLYQICSARYLYHQKHILCFTHRRYVPPQTGLSRGTHFASSVIPFFLVWLKTWDPWKPGVFNEGVGVEDLRHKDLVGEIHVWKYLHMHMLMLCLFASLSLSLLNICILYIMLYVLYRFFLCQWLSHEYEESETFEMYIFFKCIIYLRWIMTFFIYGKLSWDSNSPIDIYSLRLHTVWNVRWNIPWVESLGSKHPL